MATEKKMVKWKVSGVGIILTQLEAETDSETLLTCSAWKDDWK